MMSEASILPAIRRLYDAATDADKWPAFLEEVARAFDGNGAHLFRVQPNERALTFSVLYGYDDVLLKIYGDTHGLRGAHARFEQRYAELMPTDPRVRFVERYPSRPFSCRLVVSEAELHSSMVYQELHTPADLEYTLGVSLPEDDGSQIMMGIFRGKQGTSFNEHEVDLFGELIPHLKQAVALSEHLARVDFANHAALEALDAVSMGIVIVDQDARVMHANAAANRIVGLGDGIALRNGVLSLHAKDDDTRLRRAIWDAVAKAQSVPRGEAIAATRPSGNESFPVLVGTLWGNHLRYGLGRLDRPLAVVFVTVPEEPQEAPTELLRRLFGLTLAEARLCERLIRGRTLDEIAEDLTIATGTARSHLKSVFAKTGVGRQAELVAKILSTPVWAQHGSRGGGTLPAR